LLQRPLDATTAFTALYLFQIIRLPLEACASGASDILAANVSLNRIIGYLHEPDTNKWAILHHEHQSSTRIGFQDARFNWQADAGQFVLGPLTLDFPLGKLSVVCGSVGAGKSTLLLSLLGETRLISGKVFLPTPLFRNTTAANELVDSVAYCAQTPYLLSDSVRANILFGLPYDKARYEQAVDACALLPDLQVFNDGDETEVGERGELPLFRLAKLSHWQGLSCRVARRRESACVERFTAMGAFSSSTMSSPQ
jgi:ABC-type multidrug transport system fused ATPase/permease subunit